MSKRSVTDNFTKYTGTLTRPTAGSPERILPGSQSYFKRNYLDAVKIITPNVYFDDDISLSGVEVTEVDQLINSHILAADSSAVIYVSSLPTVEYLSSVSAVGGISKYFVKQNNLTWVSPTNFENNILQKIGKTLSDFSSSGDLLNYLSGTFLPTIELEKNDGTPGNDLATATDSAFATDSSGTHKYLIDKLSWLYFLNAPDPAGANVRPSGYSTSGEVATLLAKNLWFGEVIGLDDCLKIFERYLWSNYYSFSSIDERILPEKYRTSGSDATSGYNALSYVSGTQHRDRLETLVSVLYEGDYFNLNDTKVRDSFSDYISTTSLISDEDSAGPLNRALKAFSFSFADRSSEIKELETLVDIDHCPDELLPYLADLIGWTLIGPDSTRHRNQLRQAVSIYKAKGTKRSVQGMVDSVFGRDGAFNITSGTLFDLWESYIPNIVFYTLMTSSNLTENGLTSFSKDRADVLGLDSYSTNLETNVRLAVDRIMWELANEFPNNFIFGNSLFPRVTFFLEPPKTHLPAFAFEGTDQEEIKYEGPWNRTEDGDFYTGSVFNIRTSHKIIPKQDQNFIFTYRDRVMPIPPWEEIKYYSNCQVSLPLLESLKKKLVCFGVDTNSANSVHSYILNNTLEKEDVNFYRNSFLFFTTTEQTPFNYDKVVNNTRPYGDDLFRYLPFWSSKSSHFKISLSASSFDFASINLDKESKYALSRVKTLVNTVAPAHATADIILDVSSVEDTNIALSAISTMKAVLGLSSVAVSSNASATILTNFAVSTINPRNTSVLPAGQQTVFRREAANSLSGALMGSGVADIFFSAAPRNAIRRKNHKYLMNWENVDIRDGMGSAGYDWLYRATQLPVNKDGGSFYSTGANLLTSGIFSLGFIPSSLSFSPVPLKRDPNNFGNLIDNVTISPVWNNCQAYNSSDSFFGVEVSTTFPLRGLSGVDSSAASSFFGKRGSLTELQSLQHRVREASILHEASSIVSGYYNPDGTVNSSWPVSSSKIQPVTVSSWYVDEYRDVLNSIANQLHENTISVSNLNYMGDFAFGSTLHKFYKDWLDHYTRVPINFNFKYDAGANNIITHTYGPYLFNDDYEITASSIDDVAPGLITSSIGSVRTGDLINIGYYFGRGAMAMAPSNAWGITNYAASNASDMYVGRIEVRNDSFLSGVEFVDTSNPYAVQQAQFYTTSRGTLDFNLTGAYIPPNEPYTLPTTFAFLRVTGLDKDVKTKNIPEWMKSSVLQDNLVIKYGRNAANTFPRIRYKIEPDSSRPDFKNYLFPNSDYQIDINAANIHSDSDLIGGRTLKVWIHTEPISYTYKKPDKTYTTENSIWSFSNGTWVRHKLSVINEDLPFGIVPGLSIGSKFTEKNITDIIRYGEKENSSMRDIKTNKIITPYHNLSPRVGCMAGGTSSEEEVPSVYRWASQSLFETLSFNFNTNNNGIKDQITEKIHTKDRKYYIEIFLETADPDSFILLNTISMYNKTFRERAIVPTSYNKYELNKHELKACFDYFTSLAKSTLASRNAITTSGEMGVSGGGRLSYRDNIKREIYALSGDGSFNQVSSLIIRGN